MRYYIFLFLTLFLACTNDDDCDQKIDNSQTENNLFEAYQFRFALNNYSEIACDTVVVVRLDSLSPTENFIVENIPALMNTSDLYRYTGILKFTGQSSNCTDHRSDPPSEVNLKHVEILYWRLK
ncbi:MAG: hypothetical protein RH860_15985 [Cytophagales bacterium]